MTTNNFKLDKITSHKMSKMHKTAILSQKPIEDSQAMKKKRAEPDQNKVEEIDVETDIERAEDRESEHRAEDSESEEREKQERAEASESEQTENRENEEIAEDREGEDIIVVEIYDFEYDSDDSDNEQDECENERKVLSYAKD
jgi:hypothetical protein